MNLFSAQVLLTQPTVRPSEQDRLGYLPPSLYGDAPPRTPVAED